MTSDTGRPAGRELRGEIERCIADVSADATIGLGARGDDAVAARLEAIAERAAATAGETEPLPESAEAIAFHPERPRRYALRDADADAFMATLTGPMHARLAAEETERLAALCARDHHPSLRVAAAARAAAGVLRGRLASWDISIEPQLRPRRSDVEELLAGGARPTLVRPHPSVRARGLFCSALADLREATFHRAPEVASDAVAPVADERGASPYRGRLESEPTTTADVEMDLEIARRAEAGGVERLRRTILAHTRLFQAVQHLQTAARGPLGRLAIWTKRSAADLETRARWHRAMALSALDAGAVVFARARRGVFVFDLRQALLEAEHVLASAGASPGSSGRRSIARVRSVLVRAWGDPGDRAALARDVVAHLESMPASPSPIAGDRVRRRLERVELVVVVGEALRGTTFLADHAGRGEIPGALERRNALFERALWQYAPAALVHGLDRVVWQAHQPAGGLAAFISWCSLVHEKLGWMPSDQELLARHWGRRLASAALPRPPRDGG